MSKKKLPKGAIDGKDKIVPLNPGNERGFDLTEKGTMTTNSAKNVRIILTTEPEFKGVFSYNLFTQEVAIKKAIPEMLIEKGNYRDIYTDILIGWILDRFHVQFKKDIFMMGVRLASLQQTFNPVLDRINAEEWDGKSRVETFFIDFLGAEDNDYTREVTRKWLTGAVARALEPGIKFELMPVLIGSQGIGKSTLCNSLCPDYFLDNLPSLSGVNKDNLMLIKDNWIVEVAELSAMSKTAIEGTKAFISTKVDKYKAPYASVVENHKRRCVFIGTTNENEFLKDKTGNRRFLPIECRVQEPTRDVFNIKKEYILQLLAEAKKLYEDGETLYLSEKTSETLQEVQQENVIDDPLEEAIKSYVNMKAPSDWDEYNEYQKRRYYVRYHDNDKIIDRDGGRMFKNQMEFIQHVTAQEIITVVLDIHGRDIMSASRGNYGKKISLVMNSLDFFEKGRFRVKGARNQTRGWIRIER
jgi:predicted P-loop ATPase